MGKWYSPGFNSEWLKVYQICPSADIFGGAAFHSSYYS